MLATVLAIVLGLVVIVALTALTGYFVAQEFGYMTVDRSRLKARAAQEDAAAKRALRVTSRTSFMLSGAQLGITVTGLLVGYVAEPLVGAGVGELLGGVGVPAAVGVAIGTVLALLLSTVVQMVFGELFPKNLAIAKPEPLARALARSTNAYLAVFGWLIWLFDKAAELLLRVVRIEPVHDVEHAATPRDLEHIVSESQAAGDLPSDLSGVLDRALDFHDRNAGHAMIPRTRVEMIAAGEHVDHALAVMATGHSRLPVIAGAGSGDVDDVVGVVALRDLLEIEAGSGGDRRRVRDAMRPAVLVPETVPLPRVLERLREAGEEFACVVDEHGGLAGIITVEDIAEELVGEIADEHDPAGQDEITSLDEATWSMPGSTHVDEVERLLGNDLPPGEYETIGGLILARLHRLPEPGDTLTVDLPRHSGARDDEPHRRITLTVTAVQRRVPGTVRLGLTEHDRQEDGPQARQPGSESRTGREAR